MMRKSAVILAAALLAGCSAITDFDMPPDFELYSLNENLPAAVGVTLAGDGTGALSLSLVTPLPAADDATLLALLGDGTFDISVQNVDTGVEFNLTDGTRVEAAPPDAAGEYFLSLDDARTTLTIQFFNETTTGATLHAGGQYAASFDVIANDYFVTETFTRTATVL